MATQWQGLLKNLGPWIGSFANYSIDGELTDEVPSELTLCLSDDQQSISLSLNRYPNDQPCNTIEMQFHYPGPGPQIPCFEQGAFSQGTLEYSPFSRFGTELSMIWGDRRLRIVHHFLSGKDWSGLTLISETRTDAAPSKPLKLEQLEGEWLGTADTLFSDSRESRKDKTHLKVVYSKNQLKQTLSFNNQKIQSVGAINESRVDFLDGKQPMRLLLLTSGGSSLCPLSLQSGQPFFLEAGWLIDVHLRQRLIRRYRANGKWDSLTLVTERKI